MTACADATPKPTAVPLEWRDMLGLIAEKQEWLKTMLCILRDAFESQDTEATAAALDVCDYLQHQISRLYVETPTETIPAGD